MEDRSLLSASPWQNPVNPLDVLGGSSQPVPADALAIINALNANGGSFSLSTSGATPQVSSSSLAPVTTADPQGLYLDVLGTGEVTPADSLAVINALNSPSEMSIALVATDTSGNPISSVTIGSTFELEAVVQDVRANPTGVAAAYSDISYNGNLATVDPTDQGFSYQNNFNVSESGDDSIAGQLNQVGATSTTIPGNPAGSEVVWSIPFEATSAGTLNFINQPDAAATDASGVFDQSDNGLTVVPTSSISYLNTSIQVTPVPLPALSVTSVSVQEPSAGTEGSMNFTVSLSAASNQTVTVGYATVDNTAHQNVDYVPTSGQILTFAPGITSQTVTVPILYNSAFSATSENFFLDLSSPKNATIETSQGIGTITQVLPGLSIASTTVNETGISGSNQVAAFTVTLSAPTSQTVQVNYATANGTATEPADYTPESSTLTFTPGVTSQTIDVPVGETVTTGSETFFVNLSSPSNATVISGQGTATLVAPSGSSGADLAQVSLQVANITTAQGQPASTLAQGNHFNLVVYVQDIDPNADPSNEGVDYASLNIGWTAGLAAENPSGTVSFSSPYAVYGTGGNGTENTADDQITGISGFSQVISSLGGAAIPFVTIPMVVTGTGALKFTPSGAGVAGPTYDLGLISDVTSSSGFTGVPDSQISFQSDSVQTTAQPNTFSFAVNNVSVNNVTTGTTTAQLTITRSQPDSSTITVPVSTSNGTALAGRDYDALPSNFSVTFGPNQSTATVNVTIIGNSENEPNRNFTVTLGTPSPSGMLSGSTATVTIVSAAPQPTISITNVSGPEGQPLQFQVTLSAASGQNITVNYATGAAPSGTQAVVGTDYSSASGTLTIPAGVTTGFITVDTLYDAANVGGRVFDLNLTSPTNATLTGGVGTLSATGTITQVLPTSISGYVYVDSNNSGVITSSDATLAGVTVTLLNATTGAVITSTQTNASGFYIFSGLSAGTYDVVKSNPGFYLDGKATPGTPAPTGPTTQDEFTGIVLASGTTAVNYNFAELGLAPQFINLFINRRAFLASSIITQEYGPGILSSSSSLNLQEGAAWISFDPWSGTKTFSLQYNAAQGSVSMSLYDINLNLLATSSNGSLSYTGSGSSPYFLEISGTNPSVTLQVTGGTLVLPGTGSSSSSSSSSGSSSSSSGGGETLTFAAVPAASSSSASSSSSSASTSTSSVAVVAAAQNASTSSSTSATDKVHSQNVDWTSLFA